MASTLLMLCAVTSSSTMTEHLLSLAELGDDRMCLKHIGRGRLQLSGAPT